MAFTTVPNSELIGSPHESWDEDGFTAIETRICPWNQRNQMAIELAYYLYARLPWTRARVTRCDIEPYPAKVEAEAEGEEFAKYEYAKLTIRYDNKPNTPDTEDLVSETLEPNVEAQTLDHADFVWKTGDDDTVLKPREAPSRLVRSLDYVLTFHLVPTLPVAMMTLVGCCNVTPVTSWTLGLTFDAETLLYSAPVATRKILSDEVEAFQLTYRFSYRPNGWNKYWRKETEDYEYIYHKDSGEIYRSYPLGSFQALWPFAAGPLG